MMEQFVLVSAIGYFPLICLSHWIKIIFYICGILSGILTDSQVPSWLEDMKAWENWNQQKHIPFWILTENLVTLIYSKHYFLKMKFNFGWEKSYCLEISW